MEGNKVLISHRASLASHGHGPDIIIYERTRVQRDSIRTGVEDRFKGDRTKAIVSKEIHSAVIMKDITAGKARIEARQYRKRTLLHR